MPRTDIGKEIQTNFRSHPSRIRKRNRNIYNENEETSFYSPRKTPRVMLPNSPDESARRSMHRIGTKLKNLLKLPKAHKWVCHEWFYSNLDQCLFLGDNDFSLVLKESYPNLKTTKLTRAQWSLIRRQMGKPRRCSSAFFAEERNVLHSKRTKIRQLQQNKYVDLSQYRDLPKEIPLPLVIGTKVTARLRTPQDGLFVGSIDALDHQHASYRVTFDRQGVGTHSIPDYEVVSLEPPDMMPLSAFAIKPRHVFLSPPNFQCAWPTDRENISPLSSDLLASEEGALGGFPKKLLILMVRINKILSAKKEKLADLKIMNIEGEKMRSHQQAIPLDFQKSYANIILEFDKLNQDLVRFMDEVQEFTQQIAQEVNTPPLQERSLTLAKELVEKYNNGGGGDPKITAFTAGLTSLLVQIRCLAEQKKNSFEFTSLADTLKNIQDDLEPENIEVFQDNVELHINHIQSNLIQMGNLHAFTVNHSYQFHKDSPHSSDSAEK